LYIYIYIYIDVGKWVSVCVCVSLGSLRDFAATEERLAGYVFYRGWYR